MIVQYSPDAPPTQPVSAPCCCREPHIVNAGCRVQRDRRAGPDPKPCSRGHRAEAMALQGEGGGFTMTHRWDWLLKNMRDCPGRLVSQEAVRKLIEELKKAEESRHDTEHR